MGKLGKILAVVIGVATAITIIGVLVWHFRFRKTNTTSATVVAPKRFSANIRGPGFPSPAPVESLGFYSPDNAYYAAALLPNTQDLVILQVQFAPNTWDVESSVARVLKDGASRRRVTAIELEQIYTDASVATSVRYGDQYQLVNIYGSDVPL